MVSVAMRLAQRRVASIARFSQHTVAVSRRCSDSLHSRRQDRHRTDITGHQPLRQQQESRDPNANPPPGLSSDIHGCESSGEARPGSDAHVQI